MRTGILMSATRLTLAGLVVIAVSACNAPESEMRPRHGNSMLEPEIDDRTLVAAVNSALRADGSFGAGGIEVESRDGAVVLGGAVDDQADVERAMAIAFMVPGVKSIKSRVRLADPAQGALTPEDDRRISSRVSAGLQANSQVGRYNLSVVTRKGEVVIGGPVDQQAQIDSALRVARAVEGVRDVRHVMHIRK